MYHLHMIITILSLLLGALVLLGLAVAAILPVLKFLFMYGDDRHSVFDEEWVD